MIEPSFCLGLEWLGRCPVDLEPLFSIGEAIAVLALFMAFLQISTPIIRMRWRTRQLPDHVLKGAFLSGIYLVFLAGLLRMHSPSIPVLSYPIFWEVVGGLFVLVSGLTLLSFTFSSAQLTRQGAMNFLASNQSIVATGDEKELRQLAEEIRWSLDAVAKECASWSARLRQAEGEGHGPAGREQPKPSEYTRVCYMLLDAWSDPRFCNAIVRWSPGTAIDLFKKFGEHRALDAIQAPAGELIHQAISDTQSIAHREGGFSGLGRYKPFLRAVFGNIDVLRSQIYPLGCWKAYRDDVITKEKIECWSDAVEIALGTCIGQKVYSGRSAYSVKDGLNTLQGVCLTLTAEAERTGRSAGLLRHVGHAYERTVELLGRSEIDLLEQISIDSYNEDGPSVLHDMVAREVFDFFAAASSSDNWDELHGATVGTLMALFPHRGAPPSSSLKSLQIRVAHHMKKKLDDNLDHKKLYYPSMLKFMLVHFGVRAPTGTVAENIGDELWIYFHQELKTKFAALWKVNELFARDMLPNDVQYDPTRNVLVHKRFRRDAVPIELQLDPP